MSVRVTENAIKRIAQILQQQGKFALRLSVVGGKCAGFAYQYDLVDSAHEDDYMIHQDQACLLIDSTSLPFLEGAEIDFVSNLMGESFKITNPNAVSSCGCGASFSV